MEQVPAEIDKGGGELGGDEHDGENIAVENDEGGLGGRVGGRECVKEGGRREGEEDG